MVEKIRRAAASQWRWAAGKRWESMSGARYRVAEGIVDQTELSGGPIVEHPCAPAYHGSEAGLIAQLPGYADPRSKAGVARLPQLGSGWGRSNLGDVVDVGDCGGDAPVAFSGRRLDIPAYPIGQCEAGPDSPCVLRK